MEIDQIQHLKHHPHWDGVICRAIASVTPEQATLLVREAILKPVSKYEKWLFRDLRLASRCVASHPAKAELMPVRDELGLRLLPLVIDKDDDEILHYHHALRALVWEVLTELESQAVLDSLLDHGQSPNATIRLNAAMGLAKLGDRRGVAALITLCQTKDKDSDICRAFATEALGDLASPTPEVLSALVSLSVDNDEEINVRGNAIDALGKLGDSSPHVLDALISLCHDESSSERFEAVHALSKLGGERSVAALVTLSEGSEELARLLHNTAPELDEAASTRHLAVEVLGKRGHPQGLAALTTLAQDPDVRVYARLSAAEILASQGDERGITVLVSLTQDTDKYVRFSAAQALAALDDERGISTLLALCTQTSKE